MDKPKRLKQADRISYSRGSKVQDPANGKFAMADIHVSYSTDVAAGETPEECLKRAAAFVDKAHRRKLKKLCP